MASARSCARTRLALAVLGGDETGEDLERERCHAEEEVVADVFQQPVGPVAGDQHAQLDVAGRQVFPVSSVQMKSTPASVSIWYWS